MVSCAARLVLMLLFLAALNADKAVSQSEDLSALNGQVVRLINAGKYADAMPLARRSLSIAERELGADHPAVATPLNNLAMVYLSQGNYAAAEPLFKRSIAIKERAVGANHQDVAQLLNNLAGLYDTQGRHAEAEQMHKRSLAIREGAKGVDHPDVAESLNNLASLYHTQGRYKEAEALHKRSLAIRQKALGLTHPDVANSLNNLADLYDTQGRYSEAEPLHRRSLAIREKVLGANHPQVAASLNNLAALYDTQGRYAEAEPLYKRSLSIKERALGVNHPYVAIALNNLAELFRIQGRYAEAEPLYKRSLAIKERALGEDHLGVAVSLNNLAALYKAQGRHAEAEPLYSRSLTVTRKALGEANVDVARGLNNIADLYKEQRRYAEAEPLYVLAHTITEKALGPAHPTVAMALNNLAWLLSAQSRYAEAEPLYMRSLAIRQKALGADHPDLSVSLSNLAGLHFAQGRWKAAANYWGQSADLISRRVSRSMEYVGRPLTADLQGEAKRERYTFTGLIRSIYWMTVDSPPGIADLTRETFLWAQWAHSSEVAASLAQMGSRTAMGNGSLAQLVRERQDLLGEWRAKDKALIAAKSEAPSKRSTEIENALASRLAALDTRVAEIDRRFARDFPDYYALASPGPVSLAEVQALLGEEEALVLFLDMPEMKPLPEETFVWVVTKGAVDWVRSVLGTTALTRDVTALRCGLDRTAWRAGEEKCAKALDMSLDKVSRVKRQPPFDHTRAHKLYAALFGPVQDLIKGKHLLIVSSGPLTQLPLHVLVTEPPITADHRAASWLARDHAVTILPAVSSLQALRRVGKPSTAPRPMIGFGNPLLDGSDPSYAKLARDKQRCQEGSQPMAALAELRAGVQRVETRSGLADVSYIRSQDPLPETADELCAVAADVKAEARDILLGTRATEREIKRLSASGELASYRIVHFATHGVLARHPIQDLPARHLHDEPGLILTPPSKATEEDDGYLSASEIAALKLDADLVILSACNTAAGGATSAEPLSGLARAFIYAHARALMVSHWDVYSHATVKLIRRAIREMAGDPEVGRAEALRRSMLELIDKGEPHEADPAFWAPFVLVGEGAAGR
jgi:CHAT domain-containing protein/tetratricopeptide (TPR) repeat protein